MRNSIIVIALVAVVSGCATSGRGPGTLAGVPLTNPTFEKEGVVVYAAPSCSWLACSEYSLQVANGSAEPVEVIWDKVQYLENGSTKSGVMYEGLKYIDKDAPKPPSIVIPNGSLTRALTPTGNVYFTSGRYGGWRTNPMPRAQVGLVVTVKIKGVEHTAIFSHQIREIAAGESTIWTEPEPEPVAVPAAPAAVDAESESTNEGGAPAAAPWPAPDGIER